MAIRRTYKKENSPPSLPPAILRLPLELRQQIFSYLLPQTIKLCLPRQHNCHEYVWKRGMTSLLVLNRQIHHEAMSMLYGGTNVFVLQVDYDATRFQFHRIMKSGLIPKQTPHFFDKIQLHNIRYLKHLIINVNHVDSYVGMINYNCGGRGLTSGLKLQVKKLVDVLKSAEELINVQVHLIDHGFEFGTAAEALEPFVELNNVQTKIQITGVKSPDFLEKVRQRLQLVKPATSAKSLDPRLVAPSRPKIEKSCNSTVVLPDLTLSNFYEEHHAAPKEFLGFSR